MEEELVAEDGQLVGGCGEHIVYVRADLGNKAIGVTMN